MSYLSAFDAKAASTLNRTRRSLPRPAATEAPKEAPKEAAPAPTVALVAAPKSYAAAPTLLNSKMTTYAQVKPTVQQASVKPVVTAQPSPEVQVTATPQEVEITTTESAPSSAQVQTTVQNATEPKKSWLPWALGAGALFWFYKKK